MNKGEHVNSINKKIVVLNILMTVLAVAFLGSLIGILRQSLMAAAASVSYEEVRDDIIVGQHEEINFNVIKSAGSTSTSWLYIPGTQIDYPLVQGPDNDYYLDTDAYGNKSKAGAIFINFANAPDMSDAKTVIFGHNMQDGTMFTDLHKYANKDFGAVHQDAYIYMESGEVKHYKLRDYLFTEPLDPSVYIVSKTDIALDEAKKLQDEADIVYDKSSGGNIICLSTCTAHKYRTVVVFEYVDDSIPIIGSEKIHEGS